MASYSFNSKGGIEIDFNGKIPNQEIRDKLKSAHYRWNSFEKIWWAYKNETTIAMAEEICGVSEDPEFCQEEYINDNELISNQLDEDDDIDMLQTGEAEESNAAITKLILQMIDDARLDDKIVYQKDLANALGISKSNFSNKMRRGSFSLSDMACIAEYFNMRLVITGGGRTYEIKKK